MHVKSMSKHAAAPGVLLLPHVSLCRLSAQVNSSWNPTVKVAGETAWCTRFYIEENNPKALRSLGYFGYLCSFSLDKWKRKKLVVRLHLMNVKPWKHCTYQRSWLSGFQSFRWLHGNNTATVLAGIYTLVFWKTQQRQEFCKRAKKTVSIVVVSCQFLPCIHVQTRWTTSCFALEMEECLQRAKGSKAHVKEI